MHFTAETIRTSQHSTTSDKYQPFVGIKHFKYSFLLRLSSKSSSLGHFDLWKVFVHCVVRCFVVLFSAVYAFSVLFGKNQSECKSLGSSCPPPGALSPPSPSFISCLKLDPETFACVPAAVSQRLLHVFKCK